MTELTDAHFELHSANKEKIYKEKKEKEAIKLFDDWIKTCPVACNPIDLLDDDTNVEYTFDKTKRRE